jgi:fatty-acid desaturase
MGVALSFLLAMAIFMGRDILLYLLIVMLMCWSTIIITLKGCEAGHQPYSLQQWLAYCLLKRLGSKENWIKDGCEFESGIVD